MRFLAIHANGYGGEGTWSPAFEIEAEDEESTPESLHAVPGEGKASVDDIQSFLDSFPDLSAGDLAIVTGGQHIGILARADDGMVVYTKDGLLEEKEEFHWTEVNVPEDSEDPIADAEELQEEWENSREGQMETAAD